MFHDGKTGEYGSVKQANWDCILHIFNYNGKRGILKQAGPGALKIR
jgi:hypothetical protein